MTLQCEREIKDISRSNDNAILPFRPSSCAADNLKSGVNIKLRPGRNTNAAVAHAKCCLGRFGAC